MITLTIIRKGGWKWNLVTEDGSLLFTDGLMNTIQRAEFIYGNDVQLLIPAIKQKSLTIGQAKSLIREKYQIIQKVKMVSVLNGREIVRWMIELDSLVFYDKFSYRGAAHYRATLRVARANGMKFNQVYKEVSIRELPFEKDLLVDLQYQADYKQWVLWHYEQISGSLLFRQSWTTDISLTNLLNTLENDKIPWVAIKVMDRIFDRADIVAIPLLFGDIV